MGFSVATIAIRGKSPELIHSEYGVRPTGESEEPPESAVLGAALPGGWYLIYINDRISVPPRILEQLSREAELVWCFAEEHVMFSSAAAWNDGEETWSITHDAQSGIDHLESTGDLPKEFAGIAQQLKDQQKADGESVDFIFDIPIDVAYALTGFRYDGNNEGGYPVETFSVLERIRPRRRWWEFWRS